MLVRVKRGGGEFENARILGFNCHEMTALVKYHDRDAPSRVEVREERLYEKEVQFLHGKIAANEWDAYGV